MALYIRLLTTFFTHRKTAKLVGKIGTDALWLMPRLWTYAAEHQADGDFSSYEPQELAHLLGYKGDPQKMIEGMLYAGFLDDSPLRIHDWEEHNSYHQSYARRAKAAAAARWGKKKGEKTGKETSIASSMQQASAVLPDGIAKTIYECYPRKVDKPNSMKAIIKALSKVEAAFLKQKTIEYAVAVADADPQFIPHPATWFNGERYNDDPSTWNCSRSGSKHASAMDIRTVIQTKESLMNDLKRKHYSEHQSICGGVVTPAGWRDEKAKNRFFELKSDTKELKEKLAKQLPQ